LEQGSEVSMHGLLEERWGVGEAKVHDTWDVGALWGFERSFMLVFFCDADVIVALMDIEL
jgi:hypothetical protein